jgi:hypothetical protein
MRLAEDEVHLLRFLDTGRHELHKRVLCCVGVRMPGLERVPGGIVCIESKDFSLLKTTAAGKREEIRLFSGKSPSPIASRAEILYLSSANKQYTVFAPGGRVRNSRKGWKFHALTFLLQK